MTSKVSKDKPIPKSIHCVVIPTKETDYNLKAGEWLILFFSETLDITCTNPDLIKNLSDEGLPNGRCLEDTLWGPGIPQGMGEATISWPDGPFLGSHVIHIGSAGDE